MDAASLAVLVVDDDPVVRTVVARLLERDGHSVYAAGSGAEALRVVGQAYAVVVTDVLMPDMNGPALVARLRSGRPELPVVFMTGYDGGVPPWPDESNVVLLRKPFTGLDLREAVRQVTGAPG